MKNLNDLFENQIRMLYSVEDQLIGSLQKMADNATDGSLEKAFQDHLKQTKNHKYRLEQIGEQLTIDVSGYTCTAIKGIIDEVDDFLSKDLSDVVRDAGLIAYAQQIEHHEIAGYGTACAYAEELSNEAVIDKLQETLKEEKTTDEELNDIAVRINAKAEKR